MPARSAATAVVREWVTKAESDLRAAALLLEAGAKLPTDAVCFHAQRCAEKYMKALLVLRGTDIPKTHDVEKLAFLLLVSLRPRLSPEEQRRLTGYAAAARYPGWGEIPRAEARRAVAIARRVRREIRRALPRESLRPRNH